ncbi:MAG: hypothetical protein LUQ50_14905 [Methanospirillum sp.]|uniref:hypothetical protein n=1 Tax=Methanospirillum sp. TaxID=45200 RepID=UPI00236DAAC2|nr:hypothetical protein [Methanospirillum sp.]MDD1730342.1 hypothetical protein [Methanospirillum sp.]
MALSALLSSNRNNNLYPCGNYSEIFPKRFMYHNEMRIRRVIIANQILTILDDASESQKTRDKIR